MRWLGQVQLGGDPGCRPRTHWRDHGARLAWERPRVTSEELEEVDVEKDVWAFLLKLIPPTTSTWISGRIWMDECESITLAVQSVKDATIITLIYQSNVISAYKDNLLIIFTGVFFKLLQETFALIIEILT